MNLHDEFTRRVAADRLCRELARAIAENDTAALERLGMKGFGRYAGRLAELMTDSVRLGLDPSDDFGEIMRQVASPARYAHHLVNESGAAIQQALDERNGARLRVVEPEFNDGRLKGIVGEASESDSENAADNLAVQLGTMTKDAGNEFMRQNAEQRDRAGFKVTITRTGGAKCCPWCADRTGKWELANAPDGVFGCHDNCKCMVDYTNSKGAVSRRTGRGRFVNVPYEPPHRMTAEEAAAKGGFSQPRRLTGGANGGSVHPNTMLHILSSKEIEFVRLDGSGKVDKRLLEQYRVEYDKFTSVFGSLPLLAGFNVAPYTGGNDYGGYNPYSREITLIGVGGKEGLSFITKVARDEKKDGQWSTSSPYHTLRHELGHALYAQMQSTDSNWDKKIEAIKKLYEEAKNQLTDLSENDIIAFKSKTLSRYGFYNEKEFISESVAEYINSPKKARKMARTVAEILLRQEWGE